MVGALYAVLWGKSREQNEIDQKTTSQEKQLPYIQNKEETNSAQKQEILP